MKSITKKSASSILLFQPTPRDLTKVCREYPKARMTILVGTIKDLNVYSGKSFDDYLVFESFMPADYEKIIIEECGDISSNWHSRKYWDDLLSCEGFDLGRASEHHFLGKVLLHKLSNLLALNAIFKSKEFDCVGIPPHAVKYFEALRLRNYFLIESSFNYLDSSILPKKLPLFLAEFLLICYHLVFLPFLGKLFIARTTKNKFGNRKRIFIGIIHELRLLFEKYPQIYKKDSLLLLQARKYLLYKKRTKIQDGNISPDIYCLDSMFPFKKLLIVLNKYVRIINRALRNRINDSFRKEFLFRGFSVWGLIEKDFLNFLLAHSIGAIKNYYITTELIFFMRPERCFFGYLNTWNYDVMNLVLQERGVVTETYAHGLIQQVILYRSSADINYNFSEYDLGVMRRYSRDKSYRRLDVAKKNCQENPFEKSQFSKVLILTKPFLDMCALNYSFDFVEGVFNIIKKFGIKVTKDNIVIKIHPREDVGAYLKFLKTLKLNDIKVDQTNMLSHIKNADIIFTPMSTVIFDCIEMKKPFMVCKSNLFSGITFYREIPDEISYYAYSDIDEIVMKLKGIERFDDYRIYNSLYDKYWG